MLTYDKISMEDAIGIQHELCEQIALSPLKTEITSIGGAYICFNKSTATAYAGIVVMNFPEMTVQSCALALRETAFPYLSACLSFREVPALFDAWELLTEKPDVLLVGGHGITHPQKIGVATHFGILANQPTIGCAKTMSSGDFGQLGLERLSSCPIVVEEKILGYALRTKNAIKPLYISPGHLITPDESLDIIKRSIGKYRIPEPIRIVHDKVNQLRSGVLATGVQYDEG